MTFAESSLKEQEIKQNTYLFLSYSSEDFFSEFDYHDKIVTENEGSVDVFSISRAVHVWSHIINNLVAVFTLEDEKLVRRVTRLTSFPS